MMKRFTLCCVSLVAIMALTMLTNGSASAMSPANNSPVTAPGRAQDADKIRAEIKKLEEKQKELKGSIADLEDILDDVEKNKKVLVRVPGFVLPLPVDRDEYASLLASLTQTGRLSEQAAARQWQKALNSSATVRISLERELQRLKSRQEATDEKLSYYRDERARLTEAEDKEPGADPKGGKGKDEKAGEEKKSKEGEPGERADEKEKAKEGESGGRADEKEKAKESGSGEGAGEKTDKQDARKTSASKKTAQDNKKTGLDKPPQVVGGGEKAGEKDKAKAGESGAKTEEQGAKKPGTPKKPGQDKPPQAEK